ncbi:Dynein heavy chain 1, axonemal [Eumeta japonica]|uniref:Dynein heavy chain 1, axonemal n=1 Tax=Eumeta variegata TaxID=151549 RepID=A0A4C1ZD11_EUMVA|nr:Dynein heavy chain 1, axonemal [Eumeta japonica]
MKLTDRQRMIFEVADLAVASPATVSRCGMVYIDAQVVGLPPLVSAWLKNNLPPVAEPIRKILSALINTYLYPALTFLRSNCIELVGSIDCALVLKFLELMDLKLRPLTGKDDKPPPSPAFQALMPRLAPCWVVWAVIWSVGGTIDHTSRRVFSEFIRGITKEADMRPLFPEEGSVYDYNLHDGGFTDLTEDGEPANPYWYGWMANVEQYEVDPEAQFADIEVPTLDNVRSAAILGYKISNYNHALCVGPTGSGKTVTITAKLTRGLHKKFICDFIVFSARTSANQTQDVIDGKLERRKRGVFGPPATKRQIFFIDDLNMPALEVYGAQPPIELLRQFMDFSGIKAEQPRKRALPGQCHNCLSYGHSSKHCLNPARCVKCLGNHGTAQYTPNKDTDGWYDRLNIGEFKTIIDTSVVGAMGPPGGGRNPVTMRLMRHFHYISFTEMEYSSKYSIFQTILGFWTRNLVAGVTLREAPFLKGSLDIFTALVEQLLPTPTKCHYTFNLRDLSKVFQGMLMLDPKSLKCEDDAIRLWYHEHLRVYQDRLVNDDDRKWFTDLMDSIVRSEFQRDPDEIVGGRLMLYADFVDMSSDDRKYAEITDSEQASSLL